MVGLQERELPPSERLQDAERSGAPATLVWSKWLNVCACIEPSGRAISHWTEENWRMRWSSSASWRVSPVMWDDYFKRRNSNHTRSVTGWLPDEEFDAKVSDITQLYMSAIERAKLGERTVCIDEMTGIQALERLETYYGLVKFNGESLSISVMEHKAWISMLLQVKSFVRLVAIQELRSILPLMSASWLRVNRMPKNGIWLPIASIRINPNLVRLVAEIEGLEFDLGIKVKAVFWNRWRHEQHFKATRAIVLSFTTPQTFFLAQSNWNLV